MRVVVTGAAGFIGSHVAEAMVRAGHEVFAVDALHRSTAPDAARANWAALTSRAGLTQLEADLAGHDLATLAEADMIVHLAGRPGVRSSFGIGAADTERDNVTATRWLLAACLERPSGRRPQVVVASSSSVYGSAGDRPAREDDALRPASPYAVSKTAVERMTAQAARSGLPAVVLRYFSVYGPRQRPDMAFHRFIEAALAGRPLPVLGMAASHVRSRTSPTSSPPRWPRPAPTWPRGPSSTSATGSRSGWRRRSPCSPNCWGHGRGCATTSGRPGTRPARGRTPSGPCGC